MGATITASTQDLINQIPDPSTRRAIQALVQMLLDELETKQDAD